MTPADLRLHRTFDPAVLLREVEAGAYSNRNIDAQVGYMLDGLEFMRAIVEGRLPSLSATRAEIPRREVADR
ncbi:MAG: hypothetical protein AAFX65_13860 [Cyanobacteria bacterium J06638_7]